MVASSGGAFNGVRPPQIPSGKMLLPPHIGILFSSSGTNASITTTGGQYYSTLFRIDNQTTFSGVKFKNTGTGDNGDKVKIAFFNVASSGEPGSLAKSFGEQTLDGSAAIRTLASSWAATPGWYWGTLTSNNAVTLASMGASIGLSSAGYNKSGNTVNLLGTFPADTFTTSGVNATPWLGDYVSGTYANFPEASALTPTNSIVGDSAVLFPAFGLYV